MKLGPTMTLYWMMHYGVYLGGAIGVIVVYLKSRSTPPSTCLLVASFPSVVYLATLFPLLQVGAGSLRDIAIGFLVWLGVVAVVFGQVSILAPTLSIAYALTQVRKRNWTSTSRTLLLATVLSYPLNQAALSVIDQSSN